MIAAPLMRQEPKVSSDIGLSRAGATEVNDGGQILLSLERNSGDALPSDCTGDGTIEKSRGQFDGMARQDARVQAV